MCAQSCPKQQQQQQQQHKPFPARVPLFASPLETNLRCGHHGCRQRHGSRSKAAATAQAVPASRTVERRNGLCRVPAPYLTRSEDGKGWGEEEHEEHDALRRQKPSPPQPELFSLYEEEPGGGRPGSVTDPAPQGWVERHTAQHNVVILPYVQILDLPVPMEDQVWWWCCASSTCRLWSRLSQCPWSLSTGPTAFCRSPSAEGRTVGGSADGARIRTCGHCHESPQTEGQQRQCPSRSLTVQFLRVGGRGTAATWSRSLIFRLTVEVFKGFRPGQVPQLPHQVDFLMTQMKEFWFFFRTFSPAQKKCGGNPPVESSELSSHQMAPPKESDESGEDEAGDALSTAYAALRRLRRRRGGGREG